MDKTIGGLDGLLGGNQDQVSYGSPGQLESLHSSCCDPTVDLISVLVTIGAIAAISAFLRQAVIDNNVMGAKRKKRKVNFWWYPGKPIKISMDGFMSHVKRVVKSIQSKTVVQSVKNGKSA